MENTEVVELLGTRLSKLERCIFGTGDADKVTVRHQSCIESLATFHSQLQSAVTGRESISSILKKLDEIEKYTDPEYADRLTMSETAKQELILADEERIRWTVDHLQKVEDLKPFLDSEHIRATPALFPKLHALCEVQIKQEADAEALSEQVKTLLQAYNSLMKTITKQFIMWDEILTKMEVERAPPTKVF